MKNINILLTSVGGGVVPQVISVLKSIKDITFNVIGVDANENAVGKFFCDSFYKVPFGEDEDNYTLEIQKIIDNEKVDFMIPLSDGEAVIFSKLKNELEKKGVIVLTSSYETTSIAVYKHKMLQFLEDKGIETPQFIVPENINHFKESLSKLGYPSNPVVMKPCYGRGGRGFRIIMDDFDEFNHIVNNKSEYMIKYNRVVDLLSSQKEFPTILLMQYLPGKDFNIDVYAEKGEVLAVIPHERLKPKHGPVETGLLAYDEKVNQVVKDIVKTFNFDGIINIELAYNDSESKGKPMIYEINPRPSATIALNSNAGVNLLKIAISRKLGIDVEIPEYFNKVEIIRFWDDYTIEHNLKQPLV